MYPGRRWIFVGAKSSENNNREHQIKGVLAHELCHYVMKIIYENNEEPYMPCMNDRGKKLRFNEIVEGFGEWFNAEDKNRDDGCEGIISSVFRCYNKEDWLAELIVRVPHIYAHFDNDAGKIRELEDFYKILFDYYEQFVVPDMIKFDLIEREKVRELNKTFKILPSISDLNFEFVDSNYIEVLLQNGPTFVKANIPKLLYSEINKCCYNLVIVIALKYTQSDLIKRQELYFNFILSG